MNNRLRLGPVPRFVLALPILLCSFAYSQSGVGVSPPRAEHFVQPGEEVTFTVTVDNPSDTAPRQVNGSLSDVLMQPDGQPLWLEAGSHSGSIADWFNVNPVRFALDPDSSQAVSYTVRVPPGTESGTYWGVLFFQSSSGDDGSPPSEGVAVVSSVRVGHIIYVTVGNPDRSGRITGIDFRGETVALRFQNTGESLLRLDGHLEIRSPQGELLRTLPIENAASFPGSLHDISLNLDRPLRPGDYLALAVLDFGGDELIAGEARIEVR